MVEGPALRTEILQCSHQFVIQHDILSNQHPTNACNHKHCNQMLKISHNAYLSLHSLLNTFSVHIGISADPFHTRSGISSLMVKLDTSIPCKMSWYCQPLAFCLHSCKKMINNSLVGTSIILNTFRVVLTQLLIYE